MDISAIDRSATSGDSLLHRASATAKLLALVAVLAAAVLSWNSMLLGALALTLLAAAAACRLDLKLLIGLAAYPALFAALFAVASAPSFGLALTIVLKAVTASTAAVTLVLTTPYPLVFSKAQRVMPGVAGDALLMTYRSFFLLAERFSELLTAVRLRSATRTRSLVRTTATVSSALGNTVLYALDLAERDYDVLHLRGYSGRLRTAPQQHDSLREDVVVVGISTIACAAVLIWRMAWQRLNAYSWIPFGVAVALMAAALMWRWLGAKAA